MSRGKCKFKTMDGSNNMEEKTFDWSSVRDPFANAPSAEGGVLVPWYDRGKNNSKRRISYYDRFRRPNDIYFRRMQTGNGDVMEQETGAVYVSPEEAFGKEPVIEDYSKEMDCGEILNKAFEDDD